jgi:hypothetical protein
MAADGFGSQKRRASTMVKDVSETQCCPKFDPEPWHDKEVRWERKLFVKDTVTQLMDKPLIESFGRAVAEMWKRIEDAGANPDSNDFIMLATESSPSEGELYIHVTKEVPNAENVRLSGTYITKVFDGPYSAAPKWIEEMTRYANQEGKTVKNHYLYYTTCPKCAETYGHNYTVAFAEI